MGRAEGCQRTGHVRSCQRHLPEDVPRSEQVEEGLVPGDAEDSFRAPSRTGCSHRTTALSAASDEPIEPPRAATAKFFCTPRRPLEASSPSWSMLSPALPALLPRCAHQPHRLPAARPSQRRDVVSAAAAASRPLAASDRRRAVRTGGGAEGALEIGPGVLAQPAPRVPSTRSWRRRRRGRMASTPQLRRRAGSRGASAEGGCRFMTERLWCATP